MGESDEARDGTGAWEAVLASLCRLQTVLPDAVLVGGTASALYAAHRQSFDHDHVLPDLRERFDSVLAELEAVAGWQTARVRRPVLILGSLDGVETGVRQLRRSQPLETTVLRVGQHDARLPTLPEVLRIKAFLCLERNATRDYLDLAALASSLGTAAAGQALWRMDELYPQKNGDTWAVRTQLVMQLASPPPYDLESVDLAEYKGVRPPFDQWSHVAASCRTSCWMRACGRWRATVRQNQLRHRPRSVPGATPGMRARRPRWAGFRGWLNEAPSSDA